MSLETAVAGLSRGAPAPGVERCLCPRGYDAASCHRPAPGFWMPPTTPRLLRVSGTILIDVEGSRPCDCHGRANHCHPNTGHCLVIKNLLFAQKLFYFFFFFNVYVTHRTVQATRQALTASAVLRASTGLQSWAASPARVPRVSYQELPVVR